MIRAVIKPVIKPQEIPPLCFAVLYSFGMTFAMGLLHEARLLFGGVVLP